MKIKLLKRLREKAKDRTWVQYSDGHYRVYKKTDNHHISVTSGVRKSAIAIHRLRECRRELILDWINDMKNEKINRDLKNL